MSENVSDFEKRLAASFTDVELPSALEAPSVALYLKNNAPGITLAHSRARRLRLVASIAVVVTAAACMLALNPFSPRLTADSNAMQEPAAAEESAPETAMFTSSESVCDAAPVEDKTAQDGGTQTGNGANAPSTKEGCLPECTESQCVPECPNYKGGEDKDKDKDESKDEKPEDDKQ